MTLTAKGQATRERLLAAAARQLAETGTIEVAAVAEESGTSAGLLYRYFGDKSGLVREVVDAFYDEYDGAVFADPMDDEGNLGWHEREFVRIEREVDFLFAHPLSPAVVGRGLRDGAAAQADAERTRAHTDLAARNIRAGQRSGEVDPSIDPDLAAAAFIGALRHVLGRALAESDRPDHAAVVEVLRAVGQATIPPVG